MSDRHHDETTESTQDEATLDRRALLDSGTDAADDTESASSRRTVLQYGTALGSAVLGLGGLNAGTAAASSGPDAADLGVRGTTEVPSDVAAQEYEQAAVGTAVETLGNTISDRLDLEHRSDYAVEVTTNDQTLNAANPRIVFSGYGKRSGEVRGHAERSQRPDRVAGGVVITMTADVAEDATETDRQPVTAFAATTESPPGADPADVVDGKQSLVRKMYAVDEAGGVSVAHTDRTRAPNVAPHDDGVTTQGDAIDAICAAGCTAIVGAICDRATGAVSKYLCVEVCTPFISSLYGYAVCAAGCVILVDVINNKGCYIGAAGICAEVC